MGGNHVTDLAKPNPKPGDFFIAQIQGAVGVGVRIGQALVGDWSRYTHAGVLLDDDTVFEAQPGGAHVVPLSELMARRGPVAWGQNPLTDEQRDGIVKLSRSLVNTAYDWMAYPYIALDALRVPAYFDRFFGGIVTKSKALICSQAVDSIYGLNGVTIFDDGRPAGKVTPGDLSYVGAIFHEPGRD